MREFRFRFWIVKTNKMIHWEFDKNGSIPGSYFSGSDLVKAMQSTGLKDKNETEVYEGDICEGDFARYLIKWNSEKAQYEAKIIKTKSALTKNLSFPLWQYVEEDENCRFDVIGNIFQNPELLEETK